MCLRIIPLFLLPLFKVGPVSSNPNDVELFTIVSHIRHWNDVYNLSPFANSNTRRSRIEPSISPDSPFQLFKVIEILSLRNLDYHRWIAL